MVNTGNYMHFQHHGMVMMLKVVNIGFVSMTDF